ncbi:MAG: hypothetical protein ACOC56_01725 [Atribacterota bacterium]
MSKKIFIILIFLSFLIFSNCSTTVTKIDFYRDIMADIRTENYAIAATKIEDAKYNNKYLEKDRVLYYLDKGAVLHYQGDYMNSNDCLEQADITMEELFTKSISRAASSILLNDNVLNYCGEIHDNIYVNLFKTLNYLKLYKFDDAYVEIKRVNDKLRVLNDKYGEFVKEMNKSINAKIKFKKKALKFYNDALAHYLSYLIFRTEGEYENSRISYEKIKSAFRSQPRVYNFPMPSHLEVRPNFKGTFLNVIAFTGTAPLKCPIGGQITTYKNYIHVSNLSYVKKNVVMKFPGIREGYHFKFAFPEICFEDSIVKRIEVYVNNSKVGELELLEDVGKVAIATFQTNKYLVYLKTIIRTIIKGVGSAKVKHELRKEAGLKDTSLLSRLINVGVDIIVDATENPDLRCWRTLPQKFYIGEFALNPGYYNIHIYFYNNNGYLLKKKSFFEYEINDGLNLIETIYLN